MHTLYVPADRFGPSTVLASTARLALRRGRRARSAAVLRREIVARVLAKLAREPIEDLRIDFEDGYGVRDDAEEDAAARWAAAGRRTPYAVRRGAP